MKGGENLQKNCYGLNVFFFCIFVFIPDIKDVYCKLVHCYLSNHIYIYTPAYEYNLATTDNKAVQSTSPGLMSLNGGNQGHFGGIWISYPLTDLEINIFI